MESLKPTDFVSIASADARVAKVIKGARRSAVVGTIVGVALGYVIGKNDNKGFACYTKDPENPAFYHAETALDAARQVPGVYRDGIDLREVPMQVTAESEAKPAGSIDFIKAGPHMGPTGVGLYGPENCAKTD